MAHNDTTNLTFQGDNIFDDDEFFVQGKEEPYGLGPVLHELAGHDETESNIKNFTLPQSSFSDE